MFESSRRSRRGRDRGPLNRAAEGLSRLASGARRWFRKARGGTWGRLGHRGRRRVGVAALTAAGLGAGLAWGTWTNVCSDCPSIAQIYAFEAKEATQVYARDGTLLADFATERRTVVRYDSLPAFVPLAFVAVEDRRFWDHGGVDLMRTFRAGLAFMVQGYDAPGASTITQQLAGNMFSGAVDRRVITIRRKIKEMRVALDLEQAYTKEEILAAYLNQINFGSGHYGIQSASHYYFNKRAGELNLAEAALLAALPRAPATYHPYRNPGRALQRRNLVLELMADQGKISRRQAEAAKAAPLGLQRGESRASRAPYFVEWVRRRLMERYGQEIYEAGYRVQTTLDPELQAVADSALHARLRWVEERPGYEGATYAETRSWADERLEGDRMPYVQGAFIAMDPRTGDVRALIGGRDYEDSEFNRATQARRQPGSVFKGFVYTAALANGIPASEIIYDTSVEFVMSDSTIYAPKNFGGEFNGPMTVREALYRSINVVAVKVGERVGYETIAQYARRLGIETPIPRVPSMPIGSSSVVPIQVAEAYSTFATLGVKAEPRLIERVETKAGRVLYESGIQREQVLEEPVAWLMNSLLQDVVNRGTGYVLRRSGLPYSVPAAGKTGTTNEATNAWFVGFTPDLLTTTWVGFDEPRRLHFNATGAVDAAPVAAAVLNWYYDRNQPPADWQRPSGLDSARVDRTTGLLSTRWCPSDSVYTEYYLSGTEPVESCSLHGPWNEDEERDFDPDTLMEDGR